MALLPCWSRQWRRQTTASSLLLLLVMLLALFSPSLLRAGGPMRGAEARRFDDNVAAASETSSSSSESTTSWMLTAVARQFDALQLRFSSGQRPQRRSSAVDANSSGSASNLLPATRGRSRVGVVPLAHSLDNASPADLPSARLVLPLESLQDSGNHWTVRLYLGSSSGAASSSSVDLGRSVRFVVDTGSSDTIVFNKTTCLNDFPNNPNAGMEAYSTNPTVACANYGLVGGSTSFLWDAASAPQFQPQGQLWWQVSFDLEALFYQPGSLRVGSDILTLSAKVDGTSQSDFTSFSQKRVDMFMSDGLTPASAQAATPNNAVGGDASTRVLLNQNYYDLADGALGMGFAKISRIAARYNRPNSGMMQLLGTDEPIFGLDFSSSGSGARMVLGGVDEQYRSTMAWNDPRPNWVDEVLPNYHNFALYAPRICGVDLFANFSGGQGILGGPAANAWHAHVDTSSSCLTLPAEMHAMLISWLPIQCVLGNFDRIPRVCYLMDDVRAVLPTFSFRLSAQGRDLYLDLARLLFVQRGVPLNRLCVIRGESMVGGPTPYNAIVLGGRTLQQLVVAMDMRGAGRLGIAQAAGAPTQESQVQCAARVQCKGMQVHYDKLRTCLPPSCGDYYFFEVDPTDPSMCRLSSAFHILVGVLIGTFCLAEIGLNEAVLYFSKKVTSSGVVYGQ